MWSSPPLGSVCCGQVSRRVLLRPHREQATAGGDRCSCVSRVMHACRASVFLCRWETTRSSVGQFREVSRSRDVPVGLVATCAPQVVWP